MFYQHKYNLFYQAALRGGVVSAITLTYTSRMEATSGEVIIRRAKLESGRAETPFQISDPSM